MLSKQARVKVHIAIERDNEAGLMKILKLIFLLGCTSIACGPGNR